MEFGIFIGGHNLGDDRSEAQLYADITEQAVLADALGYDVVWLTEHHFNDYNLVPDREWESVGVTDPAHRLAFAIVITGRGPRESSANLQAPLLMNYEAMTARQVILTDSGFSVRHPLSR